MKRKILFLVVATYFFACKEPASTTKPASDSDTLTTFELDKYPKLNKGDVDSMVKYYAQMPKNDSNIIRAISFGNVPIKGAIRNAQKVRIYIGAHITNSTTRKIGDVIVILQIKNNSGYAYYDYASIFDNTLLKPDGYCPPPYDVPCIILED